MGKPTKRIVKKFYSFIARGNTDGKFPDYYFLGDCPTSFQCEIIDNFHKKYIKKIEIPLYETCGKIKKVKC